VATRYTRRDLLRQALGASAGAALLPAGLAGCRGHGDAAAQAAQAQPAPAKEALFYDRLANRRVRCQLCPRKCEVGDRERGFCGVRENRGGTYHTLVYGQIAALNIDPIEKKPFFHYHPGSTAFSLGTAGCNFQCKDCQNWEVSQVRPEQVPNPTVLTPDEVAATAKRYNAPVIAFTYTEPVVFYEYVLDTARAAAQQGIMSVMVSNGYINPEPMRRLLHVLGAVKIDLKGITDRFYRDYCAGTLQPVLDTIKLVHQSDAWLEVVYLVVPTVNDDDETIRHACRWVRDNVGASVPLHFSRFFPYYQLTNLPPTPVETLRRCYQIAGEAGLKYVYVGNIPDADMLTTYCPNCHRTVVARRDFEVTANEIRGGKCRFCQATVPGVW